MTTLEDAKTRAATTYNAASDFYDHHANTFWGRYGRRTVERPRLPAGARVLDVCCGSGASAIPAAEIVGPRGSVIGVDLAENLLELARNKAKQRGLDNIGFRSGDMTTAGLTELEVVAEADTQPVNSPEDWWAMVMGSGYRGTVAQLSQPDQERVRAENLGFIRQAAVRSLEANVVYAVGVKT